MTVADNIDINSNFFPDQTHQLRQIRLTQHLRSFHRGRLWYSWMLSIPHIFESYIVEYGYNLLYILGARRYHTGKYGLCWAIHWCRGSCTCHIWRWLWCWKRQLGTNRRPSTTPFWSRSQHHDALIPSNYSSGSQWCLRQTPRQSGPSYHCHLRGTRVCSINWYNGNHTWSRLRIWLVRLNYQ